MRKAPFAMVGQNLHRTDEIALARDWLVNRSEKSRARLTIAYQPLVRAMAGRYARSGLPKEDLVQEGTIGFLAALDNYDPDTGFSIATLARYHIQARLQLYIAEFVGAIRLPNSRRIKGLIAKCITQIRLAESYVGRSLTDAEKSEICRAEGFELQEIHDFEQITRPTKSISHQTEDESPFDLASDEISSESYLASSSMSQATSILSDILNDMPERSRIIIQQRHLTDDFVSLEAIAAQLGISRERVRRIEKEAIEQLRRALATHGITDISDIL